VLHRDLKPQNLLINRVLLWEQGMRMQTLEQGWGALRKQDGEKETEPILTQLKGLLRVPFVLSPLRMGS
jgi:serine/threonine protein kinase